MPSYRRYIYGAKGYDNLSKPDKLYLKNTNLIGALSLTPNKGTMGDRIYLLYAGDGFTLTPNKGTMGETFFANQIINAYADNRFSPNELKSYS